MTVSLHMIVKNETSRVTRIIHEAQPFFDAIFLTVSDEATADALTDYALYKKYDNVHVDHRVWTDHFGDARNHNWIKGKNYDYSFWLDADDRFDFSTIPQMVALAEKEGYDAIYLPYNYAQDDQGRTVAHHWRERLVSRKIDFEWRGAVHETLLTDTAYKSFHLKNEVLHLQDHASESAARNHKILLEQANVENPDPRDLYYLGVSHFTQGEYKECIEVLDGFIKVSGWDEEIYRALTVMSEAAYNLGRYDHATAYATRAMAALPHYPQAYWLLAQYEADQDNFKEALEWAKVADTKPLPNSMSVIDPTCIGRNRLVAAQSLFMLQQYNEALRWLRRSDDPLAKELEPSFTEMADTETFLKLLPNIRKYFRTDEALWTALDDELKYDNRARGLRDIADAPETWSDKSIVFFCGKGYEEWGPHKLDKGMGGSEEAIVYLSRELVKQGWNVVVYGEVEKTVFDNVENYGRVAYLPWRQFNNKDTFNVYVAWRTPMYANQIKAKVKIVDVHDLLPKEIMKDVGATYFFKSDYHRNEYKDIPDSDTHVIGNGIVKEQFND